MVEKLYDWNNGAYLDEHSKRKHKVLSEYFAEYLRIRCQHPRQTRFKLAVVDGFCGAGKYAGGELGSPAIFIDVLNKTTSEINIERVSRGIKPVQISVLLILNDAAPNVVELCKENIAPLIAEARHSNHQLNIETSFLSEDFELIYPSIKEHIKSRNYDSNVLFNLDQCGHSRVQLSTLTDIIDTYPSSEIFLTFAIQALVSFLPKANQEVLANRLRQFSPNFKSLDRLDDCISDRAWLGAAERTVFDALKGFRAFISPFSINNPQGWRYWLIHFAKNYRARQVYNDILHKNSSSQAHFGRSGLRMLAYDPNEEGTLYLFENEDRKRAAFQLYDDIPRAIANSRTGMLVEDFYAGVYNQTPAHSDDIHNAIISNPDLEVETPKGGTRRVANAISRSDILKLKPQRSFSIVALPDYE